MFTLERREISSSINDVGSRKAVGCRRSFFSVIVRPALVHGPVGRAGKGQTFTQCKLWGNLSAPRRIAHSSLSSSICK